ncbi:MAG: hypothetical protein FRX49_12342 [Trebouxia sp. A1-2]|nr:MAG: hypothetical protein FRX49_12342 [Trebouxia sp. A1-2]
MLQGGKVLPQAGIASQNIFQLSIFGLCHTACSRPTKVAARGTEQSPSLLIETGQTQQLWQVEPAAVLGAAVQLPKSQICVKITFDMAFEAGPPKALHAPANLTCKACIHQQLLELRQRRESQSPAPQSAAAAMQPLHPLHPSKNLLSSLQQQAEGAVVMLGEMAAWPPVHEPPQLDSVMLDELFPALHFGPDSASPPVQNA